jgi:DNA-binding IclR family transcriptional regulator
MSAPESWFATRTMQALEVLAFRPCSAVEVAHRLQVHPRTARRLLTRLVADGYLTRTGERRLYTPTMRIVALAGQVVERSELAQAAVPVVTRLHEETGEAAHLWLPSYRAALCVVHHAERAPEPIRPQLRELVPAHCTAPGKTLLAHRDRWRESVLGAPLERHTERTLVLRGAVEHELRRVRERGWALEDREHQPHVRAVAAPVHDADGDVMGALAVSAAAERASLSDCHRLADTVMELAQQASEALGYDGGERPGRHLEVANG